MSHAMRYLLSWEKATGRKHPAFKIKELGRSLSFAVDFTGLSFNDNDTWAPNAFFFQVVKRMHNPSEPFRGNETPRGGRETHRQMNFFARDCKRLFASYNAPCYLALLSESNFPLFDTTK